MRRAADAFFLCALLAGILAAPLGAQATPAVQDSLTNPVEPAFDSTDFGRLRIGALVQAASVRMARTGTVVPERDVFLRGLDASYHFAGSRYGVALQVQQSSLGSEDLSFGDIAATYDWGLGAGVAPELAIGWRNGYEPSTGLAHGKRLIFARPGVRASTSIGGSPLSLELRVSRYIPMSGGGGSDDAMSGWDGESGLRWSFPHWPIDAAIGYRFERLRVYRAEQEVSSMKVELSWRRTLARSP